jgi:hypothetical protein
VEQAGTAFEEPQFAIVEERHLAEWLAVEMIGLVAIEGDRAHGINEAGFLACPSQPQVTHETARLLGHPVKRPDGQFAHSGMSLSRLSWLVT